jgi:hypothetical protein
MLRLYEPKKFKYSEIILNELLKVYQLCLKSYDKILPYLDKFNKYPLVYHVQFMMSLENRGRVDEVNKYGLALLEKVDKNPTTYEESHCEVLGIYKCLFKVPQQSTTTDEEHCKKLLSFMEKIKIWHRYIS